ncbi:MAG TPA: PEP-CTERM sorting domain-containing protein [Pirellulales bacterium]|jgi:hypothetical protein|nr:PEP-CTERM sorting domain-containing protein [Pirellulales bacterium]
MKLKSKFSLLPVVVTVVAALSTAPAHAAEIFVVNDWGGIGTASVGAYDATTGATINASLITGLIEPTAIAALDGNFLLAQVVNNSGTIEEYEPDGTVVNASLAHEGGVSGLAVSGGDFFAAGLGGITEFTTAGTFVTQFRYALGPWSGIAASGADLFVTSQFAPYSVGEFTTSGATVNASLISGLQNPNAIAVSGSDLFVANALSPNSVSEFTTSGAIVNASLITGLTGGDAISLAVSGGDLFVTNGGANGVVSEYTTSGVLVNASLVTGLEYPGAILVTPEPSTWVMFAIGAAALAACARRKWRLRV